MGWLSGWGYRKSHEIEGSTAGAQTDYQIRIKVHYGSGTDSGEDVYLNGKCRTDFGDIRFTSDDGVTELSYWMEEEVDGDYAVFWVKVPSIPVSPDAATIYIYYGNPSAESISNGEATFLLFDDFEGDALDTNKWMALGTGSITVSGGVVTIDTTTRQAARIRSVQTFDRPLRLRVRCRMNTEVNYAHTYFAILASSDFVWESGNNVGNAYFGHAQSNYYDYSQVMRKLPDGAGVVLASGSVKVDTTTFHVFQIQNYAGSLKQIMEYDTSSEVLTATDTDYTTGHVFLGQRYTGAAIVDWVFVAKYVDPEPSHGAWGSEETPGVAHKVTVSESLGLADSVVKRADYGTLVSGAEKLGLAESITKRVDYKTLLSGTEKLGIIDGATVQPVILLVVAEKLGLIDGFAKRVDYRTVQSGAERLGLADSLIKRVDYKTLQSGVEKLGLADAGLLKRQVYVLTAERLGLVSRVKPTASYHLYIEEKLGLIEVGRVGKPIYIKVTEKLGLVDREKILLTIYTPAVTVPANTPKDAPVTYLLLIEEDYITSIDVYFPPGCCGLTRVQAYYGSEQIAPKPTGADFRGDNMLVRCPMRWKVPEKPCPIRFVLWNLDDTYSHTPIIFVTTAEEEQVKPYKPVSEFVNVLKRLLGVKR